jgi:hypothetical protein
MTARIPRPFEGVYGISLPTAILALVPYIMVTSACALFRTQVSQDTARAQRSHPDCISRPSRYPRGSSGASSRARVELVRPVADFIPAPVMLGVARVASGAALYVSGGAGLPRPDLAAWIERNQPAMGSPPLAQTLRGS